MGKKDNISQAPDVQLYRKRIGSENKKHSKVVVKTARHRMDVKTHKVKMNKDIYVVVCSSVCVVALLYGLLYSWLHQTN